MKLRFKLNDDKICSHYRNFYRFVWSEEKYKIAGIAPVQMIQNALREYNGNIFYEYDQWILRFEDEESLMLFKLKF